MTTLTNAGTAVAQMQKRTVLVSVATIVVIVGMASGLAYGQVDRAMTMFQSLLSGNRTDDIETLRILSAVFAPGIVGLLLAFFASALPDDGKQ